MPAFRCYLEGIKAKLIILSGASLILLGSTGCTAISEGIFVGAPIERESTPFKQSNYIETFENGRLIYRLSAKGKAAVAKNERRFESRSTARQARREISKPFTKLADWTGSLPLVPLATIEKIYSPEGGHPSGTCGNTDSGFGSGFSMTNFSMPVLSGLDFSNIGP